MTREGEGRTPAWHKYAEADFDQRMYALWQQTQAKISNVWRERGDHFDHWLALAGSHGAARMRYHMRSMMQGAGKTALQLGLYGLIVVGSLGIAVKGSDILLDMLSSKMTSMGVEMAKTKTPTSLELAELRLTRQ